MTLMVVTGRQVASCWISRCVEDAGVKLHGEACAGRVYLRKRARGNMTEGK